MAAVKISRDILEFVYEPRIGLAAVSRPAAALYPWNALFDNSFLSRILTHGDIGFKL